MKTKKKCSQSQATKSSMQKHTLILCSLNQFSILVRLFDLSHSKAPTSSRAQLQRLSQCLEVCCKAPRLWKSSRIIKPVCTVFLPDANCPGSHTTSYSAVPLGHRNICRPENPGLGRGSPRQTTWPCPAEVWLPTRVMVKSICSYCQ